MKKITVLLLGACVALTLSGADGCQPKKPGPTPVPAGSTPIVELGTICAPRGAEGIDGATGKPVVCSQGTVDAGLRWRPKQGVLG